MASTNKTTNYELSQFIGTDKPAWLTDYNSDMGKIDAGVAAAQSTATGADGKATANATAIGTLSNLTTTAKTNLVAAVNEVNTSATTAINTASNAAGTATEAKGTADALANYLTMTQFVDVATSQMVPQTGTVTSSYVHVSTNDDRTLGKVYGRMDFRTGSSAAAWQTITINIDTGIRPTAEFTIACAGVANCASGTANQALSHINLVIRTDGKIDIRFYAELANQTYYLCLMPCLYFFKDFGDTE